MKKYVTIVFLCLTFLVLTACIPETAVSDVTETYEIASDIHALDIQINAADFTIEHGDEFRIESNLKNLTVNEKDGVLTIADKANPNANYTGAMLALCIPNDIVFEDVYITTGAAKLTVDSLSANSLKLELGAGQVQFGSLNAYSNISLRGGAGEVIVQNGTLNNLTLALGIGKLDMTAALLGENQLTFGVGESNLTLIGSRDDYSVDIEKGLGNIAFAGTMIAGTFSTGSGENHLRIEGGVGTTNITLTEE